ncbi:MAG: hypothetical protein HS104_09730 [Polyangiaceae bacterium]|nr:hypothetical protein [Polyangiaceae bacterium]MCL4754364.1 hypothetical protein [Myxococcales bacterium]
MTDSHEAGGADVRPLATLDGPAGMTLGAPRYRTLRIVINGPDDSEPPIVIERHDWPVDDDADELDPADVDPDAAAAAARVRAAFAEAAERRPTPTLYPREPGRR